MYILEILFLKLYYTTNYNNDMIKYNGGYYKDILFKHGIFLVNQ